MSRQLKITAFFNSPASETSPHSSAQRQMQEHLGRSRQQKSSSFALLDDSDTELEDDNLEQDQADKSQAKPAHNKSKQVDKPKPKPKPKSAPASANSKQPPSKSRRSSDDSEENKVPTIVLESDEDQTETDADSEDSEPVQRPRKSARPHVETLDSSPEKGKEEHTPKRPRVRRIAYSSESSRSPSPAARSSPPSSQPPLADGIIGMKVRSPTSNGSA